MMLSIVLVKLLPQNAVLTGIFDWGQQSISLFVVFFIFKKMYLSKGIAKKENYPLYCPKCKQKTLIEVKDLQVTVIKEPDV